MFSSLNSEEYSVSNLGHSSREDIDPETIIVNYNVIYFFLYQKYNDIITIGFVEFIMSSIRNTKITSRVLGLDLQREISARPACLINSK